MSEAIAHGKDKYCCLKFLFRVFVFVGRYGLYCCQLLFLTVNSSQKSLRNTEINHSFSHLVFNKPEMLFYMHVHFCL